MQSISEFCETDLSQNSFPSVNRKGIFTSYGEVKKQAESNQRVRASLAKYVMFRHIVTAI